MDVDQILLIRQEFYTRKTAARRVKMVQQLNRYWSEKDGNFEFYFVRPVRYIRSQHVLYSYR